MNRSSLLLAFAATATLAWPAAAQTPTRIRGTIVSTSPTTMSIQSREGRDVVLKLADDLGVSVVQVAKFDDIKEGDIVGTTTKRAPNGDEVAVEVHFLPPSARLGQSVWDLEPNSKMTNASVRSKVVGKADHELTLKLADGEQKVIVPPATPVIRSVPGARADLVAGEGVFVSATAAADGTLTAQRILVGKNGVRPPQ